MRVVMSAAIQLQALRMLRRNSLFDGMRKHVACLRIQRQPYFGPHKCLLDRGKIIRWQR